MTTLFTKHCLERMSERNISEEDLATVLEKGFFRNQPENQAYAVEYGNITVVVGYDSSLITAYKVSPCGRSPKGALCREAGRQSRQHKIDVLRIAESNREIKSA